MFGLNAQNIANLPEKSLEIIKNEQKWATTACLQTGFPDKYRLFR